MTPVIRSGLFLACYAALWPIGMVAAEEPSSPKTAQAWTLADAMVQLQHYPQDAYLQYVAMQLAKGTDEESAVYNAIGELSPRLSNRWGRGRRDVDVFSIFSGALAVQESLQMDLMTDGSLSAALAGAATIPVNQLQGPTVESHPWHEMLAGRKPEVSQLSRFIPADQFLIEFRRPSQVLRLLSDIERWLAYYTQQASQSSRRHGVPERLMGQLALRPNELLAPVYDLAIREIAMTGSDLFHREGSDLTVLLLASQPAAVALQLDQMLEQSLKGTPGATESTGEYRGVSFRHVTEPQRVVHVFAAQLQPDVFVRSNSLPALQRVVDAMLGAGNGGTAVATLGESEEFAYVRTLLPRDESAEDGLLYLSDPFIRRLLGPQVRLGQVRRLHCATNLRLIQNAALLHLTQYGKRAGSLEELVGDALLPEQFGSGQQVCSCSGTYRLLPDGITAACSHHGTAILMRPLIESPLSKVSEGEATGYKQFVERYSQYWRTFFDPIAVQLQHRPTGYHIETIVLPLIDNSIYQGMHAALHGATMPLEGPAVADSSIFSLSFKLDRQGLAKQLGWDVHEEAAAIQNSEMQLAQSANQMRMVGLALHNFESSYKSLPPARGGSVSTGLSWRVHILPFLEQAELYQQFHLDEPWDSPHNKSLVAKMPLVYRFGGGKLGQGMTTLVVPKYGDEARAIGDAPQGAGFREYRDGTSNTIMALEVSEADATIWTKPDTFEINPQAPRRGLEARGGRPLILMGDGSVHRLSASAADNDVRGLFTRAGGETIADGSIEWVESPRRRSGLAFLDAFPLEMDPEGDVPNMLMNGLGDHVTLHICDDEPLVDFNVSRFVGFIGAVGGNNALQPETLSISAVILSLNTPVYLAFPVTDAEAVERGLRVIDRFLAQIVQRPIDGGFFSVEQDYYVADRSQKTTESQQPVRTYAFSFGPIKWRFCWARIGDGLYVASQPRLLDELIAAQHLKETQTADAEPPITGHGLVRVRPTHWRQILPQLELGWAENQRQACIRNIGPFQSMARAVLAEGGTGELDRARTDQLVEQIYGMQLQCPEHGTYELSADGLHVNCSVHGTALEPRQPLRPSPDSRLGELMHQLREVRLVLSFLEDGLHGVVDLEIQEPQKAPPRAIP